MAFEYFYEKKLSPLLKWPGGKTDDWALVRRDYSHLLPRTVRNFYEPFLGGGAVWLSLRPDGMFANDLCSDLVLFYCMVKDGDADFFSAVAGMEGNWNLLASIGVAEAFRLYPAPPEGQEEAMRRYRAELEASFFFPPYGGRYYDTVLSSLRSKVINIRRVEEKRGKLPDGDIVKNIEGALKAGFYTAVRDLYNRYTPMDGVRAACFYFLRDYCFSSMFRYNGRGEFNVPYGGMSYNDRSPATRVGYWQDARVVEHLRDTEFSALDFLEFLKAKSPGPDDFIFVDPPYDSDFSTYAGNAFGQADQRRLAEYLVWGCEAKFLAIMKNTEFVRGLYEGFGVACETFGRNYAVSFKDRNDRAVEHLVVARV